MAPGSIESVDERDPPLGYGGRVLTVGTMTHLSLALTCVLFFGMPLSACPPSNAAAAQDDQKVRVAGVVVDEAGAPVVGATVVAVWSAAAGQAEFRTTVKSGAEGDFEAEAPRDRGAPRITVFADGFVFQALEAAEGNRLEIVGRRILEVAFDLRLPDGSAPENASLRFEYPEETGLAPTEATWRGPRRKVIGKSLKATVTAYGGLYELPSADGVSSRWVSAPIELDALSLESSTVGIELTERRVLLIEVIGNEISSRRSPNMVIVVKESDFDEGHPSRSIRAAERAQRKQGRMQALPRSGSTRYVFDLEPGGYVVGYLKQSMHLGEWKRFEAGEGETRVQLAIEDPEARGFVTVECLDGRDQPVDVNRIGHAVRYSGGGFSSSAFQARPVSVGEFRMLRSELDPTGSVDAEPDPEKSIVLTLHAPGIGSRKLQILDGVDSYVVRFSTPVSVDVRPIGTDWERFYLRITGEDSGYEGVFNLSRTPLVAIENVQVTTLNVEWVLPDVEAMAQFPDDVPLRFVRGEVVGTAEIDLAEAARTVEITAPTLHTLHVKTLGWDPGTRLTLVRNVTAPPPSGRTPIRGGGDGRKTGQVGDDGSVTFTEVGAGSYTLRAGRWQKPLAFDLDADREILWERVDATLLRVRMKDGTGTLAESGLKPDDLLVGRNGERFTSSEELQSFLSDAMERAIEVIVRRGESEIVLELVALQSWAALMGSLVPHFEAEDDAD